MNIHFTLKSSTQPCPNFLFFSSKTARAMSSDSGNEQKSDSFCNSTAYRCARSLLFFLVPFVLVIALNVSEEEFRTAQSIVRGEQKGDFIFALSRVEKLAEKRMDRIEHEHGSAFAHFFNGVTSMNLDWCDIPRLDVDNATGYFNWRRVAEWQDEHPGQIPLVNIGEQNSVCSYIQSDLSILRGPIVIVGPFNENANIVLGARIPNRTKWMQFAYWLLCRQPKFANPPVADPIDALQRFLDDDRILLWYTGQNYPFTHPKLITLPLGVHPGRRYGGPTLVDVMRNVVAEHAATSSEYERPRRLLIAFSNDSVVRKHLPTQLRAKFGMEANWTHYDSVIAYFTELSKTKFVLSPPGIGWDCYRHYQTMAMGAIPIVERQVGLHRMFHKMPILQLPHFRFLTPQLLDRAWIYAKHLHAKKKFDFHKLTHEYWMDLMESRSFEKVSEQHPIRFPYDLRRLAQKPEKVETENATLEQADLAQIEWQQELIEQYESVQGTEAELAMLFDV